MSDISFQLRRPDRSGSGLRPITEDDHFSTDSALRSNYEYIVPPKSSIETHLVSDTIGYDTVALSFSPLIIPNDPTYGAALSYSIVRSPAGFPTTQLDGTGIARYDPSYSTLPPNGLFLVYDHGLTSGMWYYYVLFSKYSHLGVIYNLEIARSDVLVPIDYAYRDRLWELVPEYYRRLDDDNGGSYVQRGPYRRFIETIGYEVDVQRTYALTVGDLWDVKRVSARLLPDLSQVLGKQYEDAAGDKRMRALLNNLIYLRKIKGTKDGIEGYLSALTGYRCLVYQGKNLYLTNDDVEQRTSLGLWSAPSGSNATISRFASTGETGGPASGQHYLRLTNSTGSAVTASLVYGTNAPTSGLFSTTIGASFEDDFDRADGPLGPAWEPFANLPSSSGGSDDWGVDVAHAFTITGNQVLGYSDPGTYGGTGSAVLESNAARRVGLFPGNQFVEVNIDLPGTMVVGTFLSYDWLSFHMLWNDATTTGYIATVLQTDNGDPDQGGFKVRLYHVTNGEYDDYSYDYFYEFTDTDHTAKLRFEVDTVGTYRLWHNDVQIDAATFDFRDDYAPDPLPWVGLDGDVIGFTARREYNDAGGPLPIIYDISGGGDSGGSGGGGGAPVHLDAIPVTAGHQYRSSFMTISSAGSKTVVPIVDWLDINGVLLSSVTDDAVGVGTTWSSYNSNWLLAPVGAAFAVPRFTSAAMANGATFGLWKFMFTDRAWQTQGVPQLAGTDPTTTYESARKVYINLYPQRLNLAVNSDFRVAATGWTATEPSSYELIPVAYATYADLLAGESTYEDLLEGLNSLTTTTVLTIDTTNHWLNVNTTATDPPYLTQVSGDFLPIYSIGTYSARVEALSVTGTGTQLVIRIVWYSAESIAADIPGESVTSVAYTLSTTDWTSCVIGNCVPPEGALFARLVIETSNPTMTHSERLRRILVEDAPVPGLYFDGSFTEGTTGDFMFTGTPWHSYSAYYGNYYAMLDGYQDSDRVHTLIPTLIPPDREYVLLTATTGLL